MHADGNPSVSELQSKAGEGCSGVDLECAMLSQWFEPKGRCQGSTRAAIGWGNFTGNKKGWHMRVILCWNQKRTLKVGIWHCSI